MTVAMTMSEYNAISSWIAYWAGVFREAFQQAATRRPAFLLAMLFLVVSVTILSAFNVHG